MKKINISYIDTPNSFIDLIINDSTYEVWSKEPRSFEKESIDNVIIRSGNLKENIEIEQKNVLDISISQRFPTKYKVLMIFIELLLFASCYDLLDFMTDNFTTRIIFMILFQLGIGILTYKYYYKRRLKTEWIWRE
jgi:hypothetical protein